ncbi:hypothetical protein C8R47DRAFT_1206871 [Mycena vitilis]|nr:hypothetical protein C8R47DRAFT_1206871 [Mycena vitilis]
MLHIAYVVHSSSSPDDPDDDAPTDEQFPRATQQEGLQARTTARPPSPNGFPDQRHQSSPTSRRSAPSGCRALVHAASPSPKHASIGLAGICGEVGTAAFMTVQRIRCARTSTEEVKQTTSARKLRDPEAILLCFRLQEFKSVLANYRDFLRTSTECCSTSLPAHDPPADEDYASVQQRMTQNADVENALYKRALIILRCTAPASLAMRPQFPLRRCGHRLAVRDVFSVLEDFANSAKPNFLKLDFLHKAFALQLVLTNYRGFFRQHIELVLLPQPVPPQGVVRLAAPAHPYCRPSSWPRRRRSCFEGEAQSAPLSARTHPRHHKHRRAATSPSPPLPAAAPYGGFPFPASSPLPTQIEGDLYPSHRRRSETLPLFSRAGTEEAERSWVTPLPPFSKKASPSQIAVLATLLTPRARLRPCFCPRGTAWGAHIDAAARMSPARASCTGVMRAHGEYHWTGGVGRLSSIFDIFLFTILSPLPIFLASASSFHTALVLLISFVVPRIFLSVFSVTLVYLDLRIVTVTLSTRATSRKSPPAPHPPRTRPHSGPSAASASSPPSPTPHPYPRSRACTGRLCGMQHAVAFEAPSGRDDAEAVVGDSCARREEEEGRRFRITTMGCIPAYGANRVGGLEHADRANVQDARVLCAPAADSAADFDESTVFRHSSSSHPVPSSPSFGLRAPTSLSPPRLSPAPDLLFAPVRPVRLLERPSASSLVRCPAHASFQAPASSVLSPRHDGMPAGAALSLRRTTFCGRPSHVARGVAFVFCSIGL